MFDFSLLAHVTARSFSFKAGSLRYPTPKRLFSVFVILPLFLIMTMINRFFMALDHIFFPAFKNVKLMRCVFITAVPRSATTYAYHLLANDRQNFTCLKMWEQLFAPSITQRWLLAPFLKFDRMLHRPLYKLTLWCDRIFLAQVNLLHETGLTKPEEDEALLLYAFASAYLIFFFPGVPVLDRHLYFDEEIPAAKRRRIMHFYKRCVQRHVYFHDPREERYFLSMNPAFISKTTSLAETFENARLIYMLRSSEDTIASTIKLNRNIFSMISGMPRDESFAPQVKETVVRWYAMADRSLVTNWKGRSITIPFKTITQAPKEALMMVYQFLGLEGADEESKVGRNRTTV